MTRVFFLALVVWGLVTAASHAQAPRSREPTVKEVMRMALRAAPNLSPAHTLELARRARLSGLMPTLKLAARRGLQQDFSSSVSVSSGRTDESLGDELTLEAGLSFDLPRLVFATEEVRLLSVERWLASDLRRLLEDVVRLYFQRKRLMREQASAASPDPELDIAIGEAEALLDALTGGAFLETLGHAPSRAP